MKFIFVIILAITSLNVEVMAQVNNAQKVVYVGTINNGSGSGIYSALIDGAGKLSDMKKEADVREPSFLAFRNGKLFTFGVTQNGSRVYSFKVAKNGRSLVAVDSVDVAEGPFCYISLDKESKNIFCASYDNGLLAAYGITKSGRFNGKQAVMKHKNAKGEKPLAHSIVEEPQKSYFYVADLGLDKVFVYDFKDGQFAKVKEIAVQPGAGPRHIDFSPNGTFMALSNELDCTVNIYRRDDDGIFSKLVQSVDIKPYAASEKSYGADVKYSSDGRFLYATLRGFDSVVTMFVDPEYGFARVIDWTKDGLHWSRSFTISDDGKFLIVTNHKGGDVTVYGVENENGMLTKLDSSVVLKDASCVVFNK